MAAGDFRIIPLDAIGAEIAGVDLDNPPSAELADALRAAWLAHGVLLFRGAARSPEAHLRLASLFGELEEHFVAKLRDADNPALTVLGGKGEKKGSAFVVNGEVRAGFLFFHQDAAFRPAIAKGALLRMVRAPRSGGDTVWVDLQKACEALPADIRALCARHHAIHKLNSFLARGIAWGCPDLAARSARPDEGVTVTSYDAGEFPPVVQPMMITHPESGRETLLLSPSHFVRMHDMPAEEGDAFYARIADHAHQPDFTYRHHWQEGDIILWDNRRTMHMALGYPFDDERVVQRATLKGDLLTGRYLDDLVSA